MSAERDLPAVAPAVTAELVAALSPRLRKRLDAGIAKLADRPVVRDGDTVRITVDDEGSTLELDAPGGVVADAAAIRCGCLLAPDCLHRAAAASAAPVADMTAPAESTGGAGTEEDAGAGEGAEGGAAAVEESASPSQLDATHAVFGAVAAVLDAGTDGSGAVLQAELLRAAHAARLAGLPRAAAAAVSVVTALRAARAADPAFRLTALVTAVSETLFVAHRVPFATGAELAELRGTLRQPYTPDGSLRLYGLFSEPVLTASGYAGAVTWTADAEGRLYTVSDVAPGGAGRAVGAADRAVRVGDTALTHRELARAGLAVSGATVSPTGRLGAGAGVRAVRASGADWRAEPLDRLWAVPVAEQVGRALGGGRDLLFLEVTPVGAVREAAGDCLLADCGGVPLRLTAAHDHPALPHRDNLRLLARARGGRLRVIARLAVAPHARAQLLATEHPSGVGTRVDLGLDRLQHADLPAPAPASAAAPAAACDAGPEAPLHLLRRRVEQAASGGRRVLAFPGDSAADAHRLHRHGLGTAGDILDELLAAAAERSRDAFGRLLPADTRRFARAWLAAARYTDEVDRVLCAAAWGG
ncbi:hypothetical protein [Streptomyces fuscichromogenes]|uniref:SWIM-type domain-containing protein n=1 Tax=Streptomyces fuscichromogenes TaxID=1324013 RepID=A0A917XF70_9ACTN|nr:hypothetical protein [Streptomyces fuscichromogenes]GGN19059.1 hypothetical protein GCM10011578_048700 [Streptomyces fuscichromogenes]